MAESDNGRGGVVGGLILIGLGLAFFAMRIWELSGSVVLLGLGAAFLVAWTATRTYGLLVPGGILTGLGAGVLLEEQRLLGDGVVVLGLGLGFLAIWLLDLVLGGAQARRRWWPVIPGGVLLVVGMTIGVPGLEDIWQWAWPVALMVIGAIVLWRAVQDTRHGPGSTPPAA